MYEYSTSPDKLAVGSSVEISRPVYKHTQIIKQNVKIKCQLKVTQSYNSIPVFLRSSMKIYQNK